METSATSTLISFEMYETLVNLGSYDCNEQLKDLIGQHHVCWESSHVMNSNEAENTSIKTIIVPPRATKSIASVKIKEATQTTMVKTK